MHSPVLPAETLAALKVRPGGAYADVTLGLGGHSDLILKALKGEGRLLGLDRDPEALALAKERLAPYGSQTAFAQGNLARFDEALGLGEESLDGLLADLGVSSLQLDRAARGFSFKGGGPLDMRMGPDAETAADYLRRVSRPDLEQILRTAGEERFAAKLAQRLKEREFENTLDLANAVARAVPRRGKSHPATRVFLGLRMAVNRELESLAEFLERAPRFLKPGGRLAVITFHSTEDRLVKDHWKGRWKMGGPMRAVTKKPLAAGREEQRANPRSRSAKLRTYEKI